jgi:MFS family permease
VPEAAAPRFHGWRIVAAAGTIQFMLGALQSQSFGLYIAALAQEMGWSKTALAGAAALQSVEAAIVGPLLGWLLDRVGTRVAVRSGLLVFGAGLLLLSQVQTLPVFYASAVMMAIGASLGGYFALSVTLVQWFEVHRARALSVLSLGLAAGGLIVPLIAMSMQWWGWRTTAAVSGVFVCVAGWMLARTIHSRPEDLGQHVDGVAPAGRAALQPAGAASTDGSNGAAADAPGRSTANAAAPLGAEAPLPGYTLQEALRTSAFWLLSLGHALALLVVLAVNVHAVTHMTTGLGLSVTQAGWVITVMTMGQLLGVLLGMWIGNRFDKRHVTAWCMVGHALGLLCLTWSTGPLFLLGFAVFHGMAWGLRGSFMYAMRADYFGRRAIGAIFGVSTAFVALGQVGGPMIAGVLADLTGDYRAGFTLIAAMSAAGSLCFLLARRPPPR